MSIEDQLSAISQLQEDLKELKDLIKEDQNDDGWMGLMNKMAQASIDGSIVAFRNTEDINDDSSDGFGAKIEIMDDYILIHVPKNIFGEKHGYITIRNANRYRNPK